MGSSGSQADRSDRGPLARTFPVATACAQPDRPAASAIQVSGSVSTTFGGVPRVCRGPSMHCTAAYGGTRTSTALPGARSASRPSRKVTAARSAPLPGTSAGVHRRQDGPHRLPAERLGPQRPGPGGLAEGGALLVHGGPQPLDRHRPGWHGDP